MDYSIGMFLAGLVSGSGMGWYAAILHIHAAYGDPKDLTERRNSVQAPFLQGEPVRGRGPGWVAWVIWCSAILRNDRTHRRLPANSDTHGLLGVYPASTLVSYSSCCRVNWSAIWHQHWHNTLVVPVHLSIVRNQITLFQHRPDDDPDREQDVEQQPVGSQVWIRPNH